VTANTGSDTSHSRSPLAGAARWVRTRREKRLAARGDIANQVLDEILANSATEGVAKRVAVIVAHPDDEAIGAGALLRGLPTATIVHVTDGAPADADYARGKGFDTREAYAAARRKEVVASLGVIGIREQQIRGLGFVDGEAAWRLVDVCRAVMDVLEELKPDVILTHPYEGGHSDHDSTAFAVHLASGILQCEGSIAPVVLELTSYHNYNGRRRLFDFLPANGSLVRTLRLTNEARWVKRRMFEAFASQQDLLQSFPIEVERFRRAPRYLFTVPPHEGELDYERRCRHINGAAWRAQAERALEVLRTRKRFATG
jgi:LmbE family N-acetylglucosaminyl deacetylase